MTSAPHPADDCPICQTLDAEAQAHREAADEESERIYRGYTQRISNLEYGIDAALEEITDMDEDSDPQEVIKRVRHWLTTYRDMR